MKRSDKKDTMKVYKLGSESKYESVLLYESSAIYLYIGILGVTSMLPAMILRFASNAYESAYENACENAYGCACGGYRGSCDCPWKNTKMRMKIHFHMNKNFPGDCPYDPHDYYDGLDVFPSCLYDVLDDDPWHWLIDP